MATLTPDSETNKGANEVDHALILLIYCCLGKMVKRKKKMIAICRLNCFRKIKKNAIVISIKQLMTYRNKVKLITHLRQC